MGQCWDTQHSAGDTWQSTGDTWHSSGVTRHSAGDTATWAPLSFSHSPPIAAPTGKLDAWWGAQLAGAEGRLEVQLRWKVSRGGRRAREMSGHCLRSPQGPTPAHLARTQAPGQREANGRVLGYRVTLSPRRKGRDPPSICNTTHTQCNFSVPAGTTRVYLSAYNSAGESSPTEVVLLERKGEGSARNLRVFPGALLPPSRLLWGAQPGQGEGRLQTRVHREGVMWERCSSLPPSRLLVP